MKKMNGRPSTLLSRSLLAAFLVALPGNHEAFAQVGKARGAAVPASGTVGAIGATLGGLSMTPKLPATLSPASPAETPLSAPMPAGLVAAAIPAQGQPAAAKAVLDGAALSAQNLTPALSPSASKSAAAAAFEGGERFDVLSALTPLRSAAAASDPTPAKPTADQVQAMRDALAQNVKPGEALDRMRINQLAIGAGVPAAQGNRAVDELAKEGQLVRLFSGRVYIYSQAVQRDDGARANDTLLDGANEKTIEGIDLLNGRSPDSHVLALASFGEALRLLAAAGADAARAEVAILYKNAALELSRDVLSAYGKKLPVKPADPVNQNAHAFIDDVLKALEGQFYAANQADPTPLDADKQARLAKFAVKLPPFQHWDPDQQKAMSAGWALFQAFHKGAPLPGNDIDLIPVANIRRGLFPLIAKDDKSYTALNAYGANVTRLAVEGKLPPLIGRESEMLQIVKTLLRLKKTNPLIIGAPGVGKSEMVNGLAQMIVDGKIPELEGVNIIHLDLAAVVAGTTFRGDFEKRMVKIIQEARDSQGKVRLFIDEIHTLVGAGAIKEGTQDAANMLKAALADGSISLIGATTLDEYRTIEKDGALARRFNPIQLLPPTQEEAEHIVAGVKSIYEKKQGVVIGAETVKAVVALALRYITDRNLPDSALDLLDDASVAVKMRASLAAQSGAAKARREVLPEDIAQEISRRTGIPAGEISAAEKDRLKNLPEKLGAAVIGQDEAVSKVAKGVQRGRMGLRDPKQPTAAFIFLGPTGVGKTELARQTARIVFGSENKMVRLDMSEYVGKEAVSRMVGAPPGYVGYEEAGQLTEKIRRNPYSVILFDEIEKAHPEVLNILLQILEDGRLTDGRGRTVDFSHTIVMMTSNIGGALAGDDEGVDSPGRPHMGFRSGSEQPEEAAAARHAQYLAALRAALRPELIGRVGEDDGVVVFKDLGRPQMEKILDLLLKKFENQLREKRSMRMTLTPGARAEILKRTEAQKYGARPLKQIVDHKLPDAIVAAELEDRIAQGDAITVDWNAAKGAFTAERKK